MGGEYITNNYQYLNDVNAKNLWYHDHTMGITRLNVYAGLAGFYLIQDPLNELDLPGKILPPEKYDIPMVIKDCYFDEGGKVYYPSKGNVPDIHPYWSPEFFGDFITVNGKTWPNF